MNVPRSAQALAIFCFLVSLLAIAAHFCGSWHNFNAHTRTRKSAYETRPSFDAKFLASSRLSKHKPIKRATVTTCLIYLLRQDLLPLLGRLYPRLHGLTSICSSSSASTSNNRGSINNRSSINSRGYISSNNRTSIGIQLNR